MKALITGGAGFIGSNLAVELQELDWDVRVVDNFSTGSPENLKDFRGLVYHKEISEIDRLSYDWKPEVIFHLAGITDTTILDESYMDEVNVGGFRAVLKFAIRIQSKIIYASSAAVYGNGPTPMSEEQGLKPLNSYAKSKVKMEEIARQHGDELCIIGLRFFNVFGPHEQHKTLASSMIRQLAVQMSRGERPQIFKWGEQSRDQIYIKDAVRAAILAATSCQPGLFNIGTGRTVSFLQIITALCNSLDTQSQVQYIENPYPNYQNKTVADTRKAEQQLQFKSAWTFEDAVQDYLQNETFIRAVRPPQ